MENEAQARKLSWKTIQDELADENNLAIVVVEGEASCEVAESNNNSICRHLYSSKEFAPLCAEYCGKAYQVAHEAGQAVHVKCHADLNFITVPIETGEKKLAAIVGRAFLKTEDYRRATERAINGDWQQFPPEELFSNVLIAASVYDLELLAKRIEKLHIEEKQALINVGTFVSQAVAEDQSASSKETRETISSDSSDAEQTNSEADEDKTDSRKLKSAEVSQPVPTENISDVNESFRFNQQDFETAKWRSVFGSLLESNYENACRKVLEFLAKRFDLADLAWLEQRESGLEITQALGDLQNRDIQIGLATDDRRVFDAISNETPLILRERQEFGAQKKAQVLQLFPIPIGNQVRAALIAADEISEIKIQRQISRFVRSVADDLEILRLRQELERQEQVQSALRKFNWMLREANGEDDWELLARASTEIMRAERGSLLAIDETGAALSVKAAVGRNADNIKREKKSPGEKIAAPVLHNGSPLLVSDISATAITPAPVSFNYKTKSFISYPIIINNRRLGVFNVTDKADGEAFNEDDLQLLNSFAPQLAMAIDRAALKQRAFEFEKRSITDALTGLLNRRYLEERLAEEIKRWKRDGLPVSFLMIDVDEFKSYNDTFSHPEGDKALKLVGQALKATLRGADVAARYGGEEFSILLPQTGLSEAVTIAERVRERVEKTVFPNRQVTISVGIATCTTENATVQSLISAADKALYKAKRAGRNNAQSYTKAEEN